MPTGITSLTNIGNGLAANDGTGDDLRTGADKINANNAAVMTAINNLAASQSAGRISYLTKADMDADLAHADGTLADVTNDTTDGNNQSYRKNGASGAGSWELTVSPSLLLKSDLASIATSKGASLIGYLSGTVKSALDAITASITSLLSATGANFVSYTASWAGAIARTLGNLAEDQVNSAWFGADRTGATDASAALQLALDASAGRVLTIRPGVYLLGSALQVSSHTTIIAYGCTFYRIGSIDNMIRNKADGVTGAYGANSNIRIFGGTWDSVNGLGMPSGDITIMAFGHCDRIFIDGCTLVNESIFHHIEINSSTRCTVENCYISGGYNVGYINGEAIQIDSADAAGQFPWFGPYDNTVCTRIRIKNNDFINVNSGIGTHSPTASLSHGGIVIDGNYFFNVYYACIKPCDWSGVKIANNRGESCYIGVIATPQSRDGSDFNISGNTFYHLGYGAYTGVSGGGIILNYNGARKYTDSCITGNVVSDVLGPAATHGINVAYGIRITVTGNTVRDVNRSGIFMYGGQIVSVTGNTVTGAGTASPSYEGIRLGTSTLADSTRFNVEGNVCDKLGTYALQNSMIRNNNIITSATHTGNSGTNVLDNLVATTFTAG